jgi:hypothetical protein
VKCYSVAVFNNEMFYYTNTLLSIHVDVTHRRRVVIIANTFPIIVFLVSVRLAQSRVQDHTPRGGRVCRDGYVVTGVP